MTTRRQFVSFLVCCAAVSLLAQNRKLTERDIIREGIASLKPTTMFSKVAGSLSKDTKVPLRLPTVFTNGGEGLFVIVEAHDRDKYSLQLAFDEDCENQNVCRYGNVAGSAAKIEMKDETTSKPTRVVLHHGIGGYFYNAKCFTYCNESVLVWEEHGYYYSIAVKAERAPILAEMANSSIDAAHTKRKKQ